MLLCGSGFGDAKDSYEYLTGEWCGRPSCEGSAILAGPHPLLSRLLEAERVGVRQK